MDPHEITPLLEYLFSALGYFYWDEQDTAIGWIDGPTIAFREELAVILERQELKGLPSLPATLILLSACRESWVESQSTLIRHISELSSIERHIPPWIGEVLNRLDTVHAMPPELIASADVKAELVDYVFDDAKTPRSSATLVAPVVTFLRSGESLPNKPLTDIRCDLWHALGVLLDCLQKFDGSAFAARLRTGVERSLNEAEVELPPGERVRSLIMTLVNDEELSGLARLARQLLAATSLPRPLSQSDELPLGGVTDISNRGNLDRLLVSELASDDLTLAVRIATNEALYLRREQPPRSPPFRRALLLDSGVRMWGVGRLMATALGMAFSAAANRHLDIRAFRASGSTSVPIDLTRRDGVESHLATLEVEAHPGAALAGLLKDIVDEQITSEAVIITSADAVEDDAFRRTLRSQEFIGWVASVARDGRVRLYKATSRALVAVRDVRLDLDALLSPTPKEQPPLVRDDHRDLPAYCRLPRPPLRVPHPFNFENAWHVRDHGVLAFSRDGLLTWWWWNQTRYGPQELANNLPAGRLQWVDSRTSNEVSLAVIGSMSKRGLHLMRVSFGYEKIVSVFPLSLDYNEPPLRIAGDGAYIYVMSANAVNVFTFDGQLVTSTFIPSQLIPIRRQYFRGQMNRNLYVLSCDGAHVHFTVIDGSVLPNSVPILTVVQPQGGDGLIALLKNGVAINLTSGQQRTVVSSGVGIFTSIHAISRDDCVVELSTTQSDVPMFLDVRQGFTTPLNNQLSLEPEVKKFLPISVNLRKHFSGVFFNQNGQLGLLGRKGRQIVILTDHRQLLMRDSDRLQEEISIVRPFDRVTSPGAYGLRMAQWADGSRAWLDSRGLLHLRSSDTSIPELTLVLNDGLLAGWCADGRIFGHDYFLGPGRQGHEIEKIIDEVLHPFVRNLR